VRSKKVAVVAAAAVMVLVACTSSKRSTTATTAGRATTASGPTTTGATPTTVNVTSGTVPPVAPLPALTGTTTTGVTAAQIKVGAIIYQSVYGDVVTGFQARIKRENDAGGVYGRKIVLSAVLDDNQTPDIDLTDAKTLVQQDGVFAVAPVGTAGFGGATYLDSAKVPFFGWSIEPRWCGLNWGFGFQGNDCDPATQKYARNDIPAFEKVFPDGSAKGKAIVIESEDNDSARAAANGAAKIWTENGAKVVLVDSTIPSPPAVVGDYTPFAEKIMTANNGGPPDYVDLTLGVPDTLGLYKKLVQVGYKGVAQDFTLYDPRLLTGGTKGIVTFVGIAPYEDAAGIPAVQQMITDLKAYKSDVVLSQLVNAGYWTADFFIAALKKAGPNLSREALYNAVNGGFTYDNGGGTIPVVWPLGHTWAQAGDALVQDEGDHYVVRVHLQAIPTVPNPGYKGS
jgi:branched-chain amino acid transport system substrate-binding protein